jgi:serine/threonine protein kinase
VEGLITGFLVKPGMTKLVNKQKEISRNRKALRIAKQAAKIKLRGGSDQELFSMVADEFVELGGIFIKFLQGILLGHPLMKDWEGANKDKIFEKVDPADIDIAELMQNDLGKAVNEIIELDTKPFAAGSFGQTYLARHKDGNLVVIKALRPGSRAKLKKDLRLLRMVVMPLASKLTTWDADLKSAEKTFRLATWSETDYALEAANAVKLAKFNPEASSLVTPKTYIELCTPNLIVQEYIGGVSAAQILQESKDTGLSPSQLVKEKVGSDLRSQLATLHYEGMERALNSQPIHGDPHPGNIKFLPDDKVGLIDFGIVVEPVKHPERFLKFLKRMNTMEYHDGRPAEVFIGYLEYLAYDLYKSIELFSKRLGVDLEAHLGNLAEKMFFDTTSQEEIAEAKRGVKFGSLMNGKVNGDNKFSFITKVEDSSLLRMTQTFVAMTTMLGHRDLLPEVNEKIIKKFENSSVTRRAQKEPTIERAIDLVGSWLGSIAEKDFKLYQQITSALNQAQTNTAQATKEIVESVPKGPMFDFVKMRFVR